MKQAVSAIQGQRDPASSVPGADPEFHPQILLKTPDLISAWLNKLTSHAV
jgi:hypothetical protein